MLTMPYLRPEGQQQLLCITMCDGVVRKSMVDTRVHACISKHGRQRAAGQQQWYKSISMCQSLRDLDVTLYCAPVISKGTIMAWTVSALF